MHETIKDFTLHSYKNNAIWDIAKKLKQCGPGGVYEADADLTYDLCSPFKHQSNKNLADRRIMACTALASTCSKQ